MFSSKLCKSSWNGAWNLAFTVFISPIVWNMCENLHYESVYFKKLHNQQEYYWPTIYRTGAGVVSTITSYINTAEIPGELSRENLIPSHVKISPLLWLHDKSRLSHQQLKRNGFRAGAKAIRYNCPRRDFVQTRSEIPRRHCTYSWNIQSVCQKKSRLAWTGAARNL